MNIGFLSFLLGAIAPLLICSGFTQSSFPDASFTPAARTGLHSSITTKLFVGSTAGDQQQRANQKIKGVSFTSNSFISDCDNTNTPPSLAKIVSSIHSIKSGSDIRGIFTDHKSVGSILNVSTVVNERCLTPFAAYCYGAAFAQMVQIRSGKGINTPSPSASASRSTISTNFDNWVDETSFLNVKSSQTIICIGRDPRRSGTRLSDAFCRGVESVQGVVARYTGLASTPAMFEFCRSDMCDGAVMVTASHLPEDRNGFKFFTKNGGLTKNDIEILAERASICARQWHDIGVVPPSSGTDGVYCSSWVDYMPHYQKCLENAICREVQPPSPSLSSDSHLPLAGLRVVLNAGNGAGYFFNQILHDLGADVSNSIHLTPSGSFPKSGVPNPEYSAMIDETMRVCEECDADIGIMLDTDADRCGFIVPNTRDEASACRKFEALNRNRLIALLAVIFQSSCPGCTFVTDSVTSEGLTKFLHGLGIQHVRYLKGYANVIAKARELTESGKASAEVAIETSGHCAMRENGYLDDGTYTAVKVIGLLARVTRESRRSGASTIPPMSLLDLIADLEEMPHVGELRMNVKDGTTVTTNYIFSKLVESIQDTCNTRTEWELDTDNLEGVRVRIGNGGFFMLRKSLHDPILSLQIEGSSVESIRDQVIHPILTLMEQGDIVASLDVDCLRDYGTM